MRAGETSCVGGEPDHARDYHAYGGMVKIGLEFTQNMLYTPFFSSFSGFI